MTNSAAAPSDKKYLHVSAFEADWLDGAPSWEKHVAERLQCSGCRRRLNLSNSLDVHLDHSSRALGNRRFMYSTRKGGPIVNLLAHERIVELGEGEGIRVGRVFDENAEPIPGWVTWSIGASVVIRGTEGVEYDSCRVCRRENYLCFDFPGYLVAPIPNNACLFRTDRNTLIFESELFDRSLGALGLKVRAVSIPVLEEPLDGLHSDIKGVSDV